MQHPVDWVGDLEWWVNGEDGFVKRKWIRTRDEVGTGYPQRNGVHGFAISAVSGKLTCNTFVALIYRSQWLLGVWLCVYVGGGGGG